MSSTTLLTSIIDASKVAEKWQVQDWRLDAIVKREKFKLPIYSLLETRKRPDGTLVYICEGPFFKIPDDEGFYVLSFYVFNKKDVYEYEVEHPEILLPVVLAGVDSETGNTDDEEPPKTEYIPALDAAKELGKSPAQFVSYLRENRKSLHVHRLDGALFETIDRDKIASGDIWLEMRMDRGRFYSCDIADASEYLPNLCLHRIDWATHKKANTPATGKNAEEENPLQQTILKIKAALNDNIYQLVESRNIINKRDVAIAELKEQIADLEAQLATSEEDKPRTNAATEARQEKRLAVWQEAFIVIGKIMLQCHEEGPEKRTKGVLQRMCERHVEGGLTDTQVEFLRRCLKECLSPDHINMGDGPTS